MLDVAIPHRRLSPISTLKTQIHIPLTLSCPHCASVSACPRLLRSLLSATYSSLGVLPTILAITLAAPSRTGYSWNATSVLDRASPRRMLSVLKYRILPVKGRSNSSKRASRDSPFMNLDRHSVHYLRQPSAASALPPGRCDVT